MNRSYKIVDQPNRRATVDPDRLAGLLAKDGQLLLPLLDLIEHAEAGLDDLIDVMGRATIEAVLLMSAEAMAGPKQQGKKIERDIAYHGRQTGRVALKEKQIIALIRHPIAEGGDDSATAELLNAEGFRPCRNARFTPSVVGKLRRRHCILKGLERLRRGERPPGYTVRELAGMIGIDPSWIYRGIKPRPHPDREGPPLRMLLISENARGDSSNEAT